MSTPYGFGQVQVPVLLQAIGVNINGDLVATVPQQGLQAYHITRVQIQGPQTDITTNPPSLFKLYVGSVNPTSQLASVNQTATNTAQFTPPEFIPQGSDLIGVWEGQGASITQGVMSITTDGGDWR